MKTPKKGIAVKKIFFMGLFLLITVFSISAQNLPYISIVNDTGYEIYCIYISPSDSDEWGENLLEDNTLLEGETFICQLLHPLSIVSVYDILLEDEDGDLYYKWEVNAANNSRIVFTLDDIDLD